MNEISLSHLYTPHNRLNQVLQTLIPRFGIPDLGLGILSTHFGPVREY